MKTAKINDPIFNIHLEVVVGKPKKIKEYLDTMVLNKESYVDLEDCEWRYIHYDGSDLIIINNNSRATLVHELFHLIIFQLWDKWLTIEWWEEAYAYLIEYFYSEIQKTDLYKSMK